MAISSRQKVSARPLCSHSRPEAPLKDWAEMGDGRPGLWHADNGSQRPPSFHASSGGVGGGVGMGRGHMTLSGPVVSVPRGRIRADFPPADAVGCTWREACAHRRRQGRTQSQQRATDATANTAEMKNKTSAVRCEGTGRVGRGGSYPARCPGRRSAPG